MWRLSFGALAGGACALLGMVVVGGADEGDLMPAELPPVIFPPENPYSEEKRVLGKILFWDEQLSSSNTVACATCHQPEAGGADPVVALAPGPDGVFGTLDDEFTSFGVIASDANNDYQPLDPFGFDTQATGRSAPPAIMAMYAPALFWDGRATSEFRDPLTGDVLIQGGGALESQALAPVLSSVEMAHADRDWNEVTAKLERVVPMALGTDLPPDMAQAIATYRDYPSLFAAAFGDPEITPARIAFAIATYERTLVPDQTPWDRFMAGDSNAMTQAQIRGWNMFSNSGCVLCHIPPEFTDHSFRNLGVRPTAEDVGLQAITGDPEDRGKFKTSTLRNTGLKPTYMHTGDFTTQQEVLDFYAGPGAPGNDNRDPSLPIVIPPPMQADLIDFLDNALTDPRVANAQFPFDRPTLYTQRPQDQPTDLGGGTPGSNGIVPQVIAESPAHVGNDDFRLGVHGALGGTTAWVAMSASPPVNGEVQADELFGPITLSGQGPGFGYGTWHWQIPADPSLEGQTRYLQWRIEDPAGTGGIALSDAVEIRFFCGPYCPSDCAADFDGDGDADADDFFAYLDLFAADDPAADLDGDGDADADDFFQYLDAFIAGC